MKQTDCFLESGARAQPTHVKEGTTHSDLQHGPNREHTIHMYIILQLWDGSTVHLQVFKLIFIERLTYLSTGTSDLCLNANKDVNICW